MGKVFSHRQCPDCGSEKVATERRIDGDSICSDCGFKDKTVKFDKYRDENKPFSIALHLTGPCGDSRKQEFVFDEKYHIEVHRNTAQHIFEHEGRHYRATINSEISFDRIPNLATKDRG